MLEIERTFLVKQLPANLNKYPAKIIKQGYLSHLPSPLRIRQIGNKFELTKKIPQNNDVTVNEELTLPLTEPEFSKLWPLCESSLEKTRHYIPLDATHTAELDIFDGKLDGYMVVEVEFKSEKDRDLFVIPHWFGQDISVLDISSSRKLSMMPIEEIRAELKKIHAEF